MVPAVQRGTRWTTRIIPFVLAGCVGLTTYVVIKRICVDHFLSRHELDQPGRAIVFLVLYPILLVLVVASYMRVFWAIHTNPGLLPLGPQAVKSREEEKQKKRLAKKPVTCRDIFMAPQNKKDSDSIRYNAQPDDNPDSPGLELFYSKDVFICTDDGRPRWCSSCQNWKLDRVHHCSDIGRCVKKMDHYCPWVGGVVGETSFKFFVQFIFYTTLYCIVTMAASALCLALLVRTNGLSSDGFLIAELALAGFFGLFTFAMTATACCFIWTNVTNVDYIKAKSIVYQIAIRVPRGTSPGIDYGIVIYPLSHPPSEKRPMTPSPPNTTGHLSPPHTGTTNSPSGGTRATTIGSDSTVAETKPARLMSPLHAESPPPLPPPTPPQSRDALATRTFAIVKTRLGENPWDLGPWRNWRSVMGERVIDWFLPIRHSPCGKSESDTSFYEMGPLIQTLRERYGLPEITEESERLEVPKLGRRLSTDGRLGEEGAQSQEAPVQTRP